jgi:hypothetical protein
MDYQEMMLAVPLCADQRAARPLPRPVYLHAAALPQRRRPARARRAPLRLGEAGRDDHQRQTTGDVTDLHGDQPGRRRPGPGRHLPRDRRRPAGPPADFANFTIVRQLFEQPTISQAAHILFPDAFTEFKPGPLFATTVLYQVDQPGTTVQPIEAELVISASLTPAGIPPGTYRSPSLLTSQLGSFRLQCKQFVTLPGGCSSVNFPRPPALRKLKVAVLGGGPAACTAALYLARQRDRYEVSLYTTGFRLGGKCQSWRNPDKAFRIEEHGLHAFLGFYHNAFTAVHDAYLSAFPDDGLGEALYRQAFHAEPNNGVMVFHKDVWTYCPTPGRHLAPLGQGPVSANLHSGQACSSPWRARSRGPATTSTPSATSTACSAWPSTESATRSRASGLPACAAPPAPPTAQKASLSSDLLGGLTADVLIAIRDAIALIFRLDKSISTYAWFLWTGVDTLLTIVIGLLEQPGAKPRRARRRRLPRLAARPRPARARRRALGRHRPGLRDPVRPPAAALDPAALRTDRREGARRQHRLRRRHPLVPARVLRQQRRVSYRFTYSCAQTIMTPMYLALQKLGAKVHFFHTVTGLELAPAAAPSAASPPSTSSARPRSRPARRLPAAAHPDLPNNPPELRDWPMDPALRPAGRRRMVQGEPHRLLRRLADRQHPRHHGRALREGVDFDLAVLGVPLGALPLIESPLTSTQDPAADPRWKAMIDGIAVTQTMSFQLWFGTPAATLLAEPRGLLTAYVQPEPSYGDFTPLISYEDWSDPKPQYCAYFTGASYSGKPPLPPQCGPDYPAKMQTAWTVDRSTPGCGQLPRLLRRPRHPDKFPAFLNLLTAPGAVTP